MDNKTQVHEEHPLAIGHAPAKLSQSHLAGAVHPPQTLTDRIMGVIGVASLVVFGAFVGIVATDWFGL